MQNQITQFDQGNTAQGKVSSLPPGLVRSSTTKTIVLAPSGFLQIPVTGNKFYIVDSDSAAFIGIKTDRTIEELFTAGTGKAFVDEQYFKVLELRNTSATETVTMLFFAGWGDYIDRRLTVVDGRFNSIVPVKDAPTKSYGRNTLTVAANANLTFNGVPTDPAVQTSRRSIQVSNLDPAISLFIRDSAGNSVGIVFPLTSYILFDSGIIHVVNDAASPVQAAIGETWFAKAYPV